MFFKKEGKIGEKYSHFAGTVHLLQFSHTKLVGTTHLFLGAAHLFQKP